MINYTIIIPHKNSIKYLQRCLDSIPDKNDIQIIIVDDNSDAVEINNFPGLNKKNTEVYFTKEGKGAGYARNIGLSHAKGKWLLFADADDYFNDGFYDVIEKYVNSDYEIIYFSATSIDNNSGAKANRNKNIVKVINNFNKEKYKTFEDLIFKNWTPWSKMFKHKYIKQKNLLFEEVKVGNDALFVLESGINAKKIAVDKYPIYCVTYSPNSLTYTITSETRFDERFNAKIRINNYLHNIQQNKYKIPLGEDIVISMNYGFNKFFNAITQAKKNNNKIIFSISKSLIKRFLKKLNFKN